MENSASVYREARINELLAQVNQNTPEQTVSILRNQAGLKNKFIGYGNEDAVNQLISHHSIVFEPERNLVWVSTNPWQLGAYMAYDLNKIFSMNGISGDFEINDSLLTIPADSFLLSNQYQNFNKYRSLEEQISNKEVVNPDSIVSLNPEYYHAYVIAGDYLFDKKQFSVAIKYYESALTKVIATKTEENYIREQIIKCKKHI